MTDTGSISDGYHTFDELYEHRHALFLALMSREPSAWISRCNSDGSTWEGWFVAGIEETLAGQVSYHLPERLWGIAVSTGARVLDRGVWDGHTSADVVDRLKAHANCLDSNART